MELKEWLATYAPGVVADSSKYEEPEDSPYALDLDQKATVKWMRENLKTDVEAVAHSLKKWRGIKAAIDNLWLSHGVINGMTYSGTCALCVRAADPDGSHNDPDCNTCPLVRSGSPSCETLNRHVMSPWWIFNYHDDPDPMINALEVALQWAKEQEAES